MRNEIVSKINDTKEAITKVEYEAMREYLKKWFVDDYIDDSTDEDIVILYLKQSIEDMTKEESYYYFGNDNEIDLYLCAKALYSIVR
jgi:hypothetical protein